MLSNKLEVLITPADSSEPSSLANLAPLGPADAGLVVRAKGGFGGGNRLEARSPSGRYSSPPGVPGSDGRVLNDSLALRAGRVRRCIQGGDGRPGGSGGTGGTVAGIGGIGGGGVGSFNGIRAVVV